MLANALAGQLAVLRREVDADEIAPEIQRRDRRRARTDKGIEDCGGGGRLDNAIYQRDRKGGRVRIAHLLREFPDITDAIGFRDEPEPRFGDQVDDLVGRQEVAGIEVETALALPDDDLPDREAGD